MLDLRAQVLPAWPALGTPHAYGGRIQAQSELAIPLNEGCVFIIDGSATVRSITPHPPGVVVTLFFTGAPTFANSAKLVIPGASDFAFAAGQTVQLFSLGNGMWVVLTSQPGALRYDIPLSLSAAQQSQARANASAALRGSIFGLTLTNQAGDINNNINIAVGEAASTETNPALMVLASSITKVMTSNWSIGDFGGGLDTGSKAVSTWYYVWLIRRSDTGVVDALFSLSSTAPTMPTNYDQKRRIGAIRNNSSSNLFQFSQRGDEFLLKTTAADVNTTVGTTSALYTLTVPPISGIRVLMNGAVTSPAGAGSLLLFSSPDQNDQAANGVVGNSSVYANASATSNFVSIAPIRTVSGQIRGVSTAAGTTVYVATYGWTDERGRFA